MGRLELGRAPALNPNASASAWVRRTTKEDTALFNLVANLSREPGHPIAYLRASHAAGALELDAASAAETAPSGGARRASTPSDAGARARGMAAATMGMASMEPGADAPVDDARSVATRCAPRPRGRLRAPPSHEACVARGAPAAPPIGGEREH